MADMEAFMNKSMKKNIRHFFLLTAFAAGTIHLVNRFIDFTASMKNILKKKCVIALDIFYISSQYFFSVYVISEIIKALQLSTIAKNQ